MTPGAPWHTKAGVEHWHGADPAQDVVQLTIYEGEVKWLEAVTDAVYRAAPIGASGAVVPRVPGCTWHKSTVHTYAPSTLYHAFIIAARRRHEIRPAVVLLFGVYFLGSTAPASARQAPTFTKDVAPILYKNCSQCHRPNEVAPMPLMTYEQVRPWARSIKSKVLKKGCRRGASASRRSSSATIGR